MVLLDELLDVLGCRTAGAGLVQAAAGHERHDRQHLGAGSELQDREEVGEVVAQDVAGRGDGVEAADDAFEGVPHGADLRHDLDVETLGVVLRKVLVDLLDQLVLVRAVRVEPEQHRHTRVTATVDGQLDPVLDRGVLDDAQTPDVAFFDGLGQQDLTGLDVGDVGGAADGDLEGLVVRAVLLGLLRHQPTLGTVPIVVGSNCPLVLQKLIISW